MRITAFVWLRNLLRSQWEFGWGGNSPTGQKKMLLLLLLFF